MHPIALSGARIHDLAGMSLELYPGALFVLDEPTVGLHPGDLPLLVTAMRELAERGNLVLVVEHDPEVIAAVDRVIELGPGAGRDGGRVVRDCSPTEAAAAPGRATRRARRGCRSRAGHASTNG